MKIEIPVQVQDQYNDYMDTSKALKLQQQVAQAQASVWTDSEEVKQTINNRLGWISCIDTMLDEVPRINSFYEQVCELGYTHCVLLGMGGSSLAPEAFSQLVGDQNPEKTFTLEVLDNTSPDAVNRVASRLDWSSTLFIIASKSGTTLESDSLYRFFYQQLSKYEPDNPGQHFVAITDPQTVLQDLAREKDFLKCFLNPADIGGRFSVLSMFGLVPAALVGIDIKQMLESARSQQQLIAADVNQISDSTRLGVLMGLAAQAGFDKLVLSLNPELMPFASWLEQLVAESTGKSGKGVLPVIKPLAADQDRTGGSHCLHIAFAQGQSNDTKIEPAEFKLADLGGEFFKWEWATAIAGAVMNINPFDEPNVSENKRVTNEVLDTERQFIFSQLNVTDNTSLVFDGTSDTQVELNKRLDKLLETASDSDYLAVLAYAVDSNQMQSLVEPFRQQIEEKYKIVSTFGIGPRYLHSTGQLHKGGANNGIFLLITTGYNNTVEIPGSNYSFNELNCAQALGDKKVLIARKRRLLHIHLPVADEQLLSQLRQSLTKHAA